MLNPRKGFTIKPNKKLKVRPTADWHVLPSSFSEQFHLGVTHGKRGWRVGPVRKDRKLVQKGVQGVLNNYYMEGGQYIIEQVYSSAYKAFQGAENILAVKFEGGQRGWITDEGQAITEDGFRNFLQSLDSTIVGGGYKDEPGPLTMFWDFLGPKQRAKVVDALRGDFWGTDDFWEDFDSKEGSGFQPHQVAIYDSIIQKIAGALDLDEDDVEKFLEWNAAEANVLMNLSK